MTPAARTTTVQARLTVFPPGTSAAERRALKRYRDWPTAGAVLALFLMLLLGDVWPAPLAVTVAVVAYVGGVVLGARRTRALRSRCRRIEAVFLAGRPADDAASPLERCKAQLESLEAGFQGGRLSPVDFEAGWAAVYRGIPENPGR